MKHFSQLSNSTQIFFDKIKGSTTTNTSKDLSINEYRSKATLFYQQVCEKTIAAGIAVLKFNIPGPDQNPLSITMLYNQSPKYKLSPALIFSPGGGFVLDLDIYDSPCSKIASNANCTVFIVRGRIAPEYKHNIGLNDAYFATQYLYNSADKYNIDKTKFMVGGNSSGGNFAALITNKARHNPNLNIYHQLLISPRVDISLSACGQLEHYIEKQSQDIMLSRESQEYCRSLYLPDGMELIDPEISPYYDNLANLPPTTIIVGEFDALLGDSIEYTKKLERYQVKVGLIVANGLTHSAFICQSVMDNDQDIAVISGMCLSTRLNEDQLKFNKL